MTVIWDTETTGLVTNRCLRLDRQPHVWEFFGVDVDLDTGEHRRELHWVARPPVKIDEKVRKITGIRDEDLEDKPPIGNFLRETIDFLRSSDGVIAHNLSFDMDMIEIEADRLGLAFSWVNPICSVEATMFMRGFRLSLTALHQELFGDAFPGAHRAREDVMALARVCVELRKREMI